MASDATHQRKARAIRAVLAEKFPLCFSKQSDPQPKRPLKIGIHLDIAAACPDLSSYAIKAALNDYTRGPKYARCMVAGAERIDLDGQPCGVVTMSHAEVGALKALSSRQADALCAKIRDLSLFACHVRGSGEMIACPDYAGALELSDYINRMDQTMRAVPAPWLGSYDEHKLAMHCGQPTFKAAMAA